MPPKTFAALAALLFGLAAVGQANAAPAGCNCAKAHHRAAAQRQSATPKIDIVNLGARHGQATNSLSAAPPEAGGYYAPYPAYDGIYGTYDSQIPLGFGPGYVIASGFAYDPPRGWISPGFWRGRAVYGALIDDDWRRP